MLLLSLILAGCTPTCDQVCTHLVEECGDLGTERSTAAECEEQCISQKNLLIKWRDTQKQDAFYAELECLESSSCDEIAAGACYDEDIWSF